MFNFSAAKRDPVRIPSLSPAQMQEIGREAIAEETGRIKTGTNVNDQPARPLSRIWAQQKNAAGKQPIRDLDFTGAMLRSIAVTDSGVNTVTVGFIDSYQEKLAALNERIEPMLGISTRDEAVVDQRAESEFATSVEILNK